MPNVVVLSSAVSLIHREDLGGNELFLSRSTRVFDSATAFAERLDSGPVSLEGVKEGHILATHSQGFYLQGFSPFELLYWNKELGYVPFNDTLTGPILINRDNIDKWVPFTRNIFGDETYDGLAQGQWQ